MIAGLSRKKARKRIVERARAAAVRARRRSRAPRAARPARSRPRSPRRARSPRSPGIGTARCGKSPAWRSCRRSLPARTFAEDAARPAPADRRPGHRRRLPRAGPHAAAGIRSRCCAGKLQAKRLVTAADIARTPHGRIVPHRRHRHRPPAPGHRERRRLRHARRRNRRDQRDRLARPVRPPAARAARRAADGGLRHASSAKARSST